MCVCNAPISTIRFSAALMESESSDSRNHYQLAHLLEFGHAKRGGGRVAAQPHIAQAEKHGSERLEEKLRKALEG